MILLFIELLLIIVNLFLVAIIYKGQRSYAAKRQALETTFIVFVLMMNAWIVTQLLYDYITQPNQLALAQLLLDVGFIVVTLLVLFFWLFMKQFAQSSITRSSLILHILSATVVVITGLATRPVYASLEESKIIYEYRSALYALFSMYLLGYFIAGLRLLFARKNLGKTDPNYTKKRKTLLVGFATGLFFVIVGNVVIPIAINDNSAAITASLETIFLTLGATALSLSAAFSAFNLGVFNFRKFIFRSIVDVAAYIIPTGLLLLVFALISERILSSIDLSFGSWWGRAAYIALVLLATVSVKYFRLLSTKLVARFFAINEFSEHNFAVLTEQLVKNEMSESLVSKFAWLCKNHLSIDRVAIYIRGSEEGDLASMSLVVDTESKRLTETEYKGLINSVNSTRSYALDNEYGDVQDVYSVGNIFDHAVKYEQNQIQGILFLGSKTNGKRYYIDEITALRKGLIDVLLGMQSVFRLQQLVEFNKNLENRIQKATRELRSTNTKLRMLDEAKDEFISMASHQLRTPLTSIKGYISMVLEGDAGKVPPQQQEMLQASFSSAQRMVYLIADLLNVSRLQTGKFVIEPVDTNLAELVAEELAQLKEAAAAKKINIVYNKPGNFPTIKLDETKIRQVIMNFADNALYYTPVGGEVVVELHDKPKSIELLVKDNGIGVPKAEQHKLFTKFYRAGNARKARPDGTGLGLFMAQKVIIASGGAVIFKSTEGKGSTFGLTFPKK